MKNIFFFRHINAIGGIETFFYNLARKYGADHDITYFYITGDPLMLNKLRKYVRCKEYKGQKIKCDRAFFNFNLEALPTVEAKEYYQIAHGDYKAMGIKLPTSDKIQQYIGVSQTVCDSLHELTGKDVKLSYNPLVSDKPRKVLNLISASRFDKWKGHDRIVALADALDAADIPYIWTIYTDSDKKYIHPNLIYREARHDITDFIANSDYLVQLSDNEGYCYSVVEALTVGTPVIVTDCPVFTELGVKNGVNGFILPFDMSEIPVDAIYKGVKRFKFTPPEDSWGDILAPGMGDYEAERKKPTKVKTKKFYHDLLLQKDMNVGDEQIVTAERAELLEDLGVAVVIDDDDPAD